MVVVAVGHHIAVITAEQQARNLFYKSIIDSKSNKKYTMVELKFMPFPANIHLHHESLHTGVDLSHQATCPEHAT